MINNFKENFFSLINNINDKDDLINFMVEKKAFNEEFIELISNSNRLKKLTNVRKNNTKNYKDREIILDIKDIKNDYKIKYDDKDKKIKINISDNDIFSYYDDEQELNKKLQYYIDKEEYENASIIYNFIEKCKINENFL